MRAGARPYVPRVIISNADGSINTSASIAPSLAAIVGSTVHYTASPPEPGLAAVQAVARYQVGLGAQEDFPAIAYTMVVPSDGVVYWCHDFYVRCWHDGLEVGNVPRNRSHYSICYIGDVEPNVAQLEGLAQGIVWADHLLGRVTITEGHHDPMPSYTRCPGDKEAVWMPKLKARVVALR